MTVSKNKQSSPTSAITIPSFKLLPFGIFLILFVCSCSSQETKKPDISQIKVSLQTYRFDKDIYDIDTNHIGESLEKLHEKYPGFLDYYLDTFMAFDIRDKYEDTGLAIRKLDTFLTYKDFRGLEDTIKYYYPDSKETDMALETGFRYYKYYYPDLPTPVIIYITSGLSNWPSFPLDKNNKIICISLDWFLGPQFPYYSSVGVPGYMLSHVCKSYLPVSAFSSIYKGIHPFITDDKTLLDMMIQRGKEQYFLHKILPDAPDSVLFGFTNLQLRWCAANEAVIYNFFIHQGLLYNKDIHNTQPYVNDGPYALGLEEITDKIKTSPGNVGTWLGYRIVCGYMAAHPQATLAQLTSLETEAPKFLDEARYRPK
jgi:hypothetical protein